MVEVVSRCCVRVPCLVCLCGFGWRRLFQAFIFCSTDEMESRQQEEHSMTQSELICLQCTRVPIGPKEVMYTDFSKL